MIHGDRDVAMERAPKDERVLESGKDLSGALKESNDRIAQVMSNLHNAKLKFVSLLHRQSRTLPGLWTSQSISVGVQQEVSMFLLRCPTEDCRQYSLRERRMSGSLI